MKGIPKPTPLKNNHRENLANEKYHKKHVRIVRLTINTIGTAISNELLHRIEKCSARSDHIMKISTKAQHTSTSIHKSSPAHHFDMFILVLVNKLTHNNL